MPRKRTVHGSEFKAKVALAAVRGLKTVSELAGEHGVHPTLIAQWKKRLLSEASVVFEREGTSRRDDSEKRESALYEQIGKLQVELEWLKKNLPCCLPRHSALFCASFRQILAS
jgi:transposase-like protein